MSIGPPRETLLDVAMEVYTVYTDLLTKLLQNHNPCTSFNPKLKNMTCRFCATEFGDPHFGRFIQLLGQQVASDPFLQYLPEPETGFDPDDIDNSTIHSVVCLECCTEMLPNTSMYMRFTVTYTCPSCGASETYNIPAKPLHSKELEQTKKLDFRPKFESVNESDLHSHLTSEII